MKKAEIQKFWDGNYNRSELYCDDEGRLIYKNGRRPIGKYDWDENTGTLYNLRELISNNPSAQKWISQDFEKSLKILGNQADLQHDALNQ